MQSTKKKKIYIIIHKNSQLHKCSSNMSAQNLFNEENITQNKEFKKFRLTKNKSKKLFYFLKFYKDFSFTIIYIKTCKKEAFHFRQAFCLPNTPFLSIVLFSSG